MTYMHIVKNAETGVVTEIPFSEEEIIQFQSSKLVPQVVTRRQARKVLLMAGILSQVTSAIDAIPDELNRESTRIDWEDATEFKRDDATLIALATALNLTDEQLDQLFIQASQI